MVCQKEMSKQANLEEDCHYLFIYFFILFLIPKQLLTDITLDDVGLQKSKPVFLLNSVRSKRYIVNRKEMEDLYFVTIGKKN